MTTIRLRQALAAAALFSACGPATIITRPAEAPNAGVPTAELAALPLDGRLTQLSLRYWASYDRAHSGFDPRVKRIEPASLDLAHYAGRSGYLRASLMVQKTLLHSRELIDAADGGMSDYSLAAPRRGPWRSPVATKSLETQAVALHAFTLAASSWTTPAYREAAAKIASFAVRELGRADGGFDAQKGTARASIHGTAAMTIALVEWSEYKRDAAALARAVEAGAFLARGTPSEALAGAAFLALYRGTRDHRWLDAAEAIAAALRVREIAAEERIEAVRFAGAFARVTGRIEDQRWAMGMLAEIEIPAGAVGEDAAAVLLTHLELAALSDGALIATAEASRSIVTAAR